ncbi:glycoside hydrolase family 2 protein [Anditalea andensis]|uniref:Beta-glucuronidase n=1 Tax=Anditalea andensis TaxID=1048983 RepID=A0A074KUX1_9BACT|nr:glycoside hydrolase family 2 TIM barrel-domain containing protein [Anditalea andensis]KEO72684.1 beta-glucuronidase [Anditalea andensis]
MKKYPYYLLVLVMFITGFVAVAQEIEENKNLIQNVKGRKLLSLNGRWNYIIDPYEMGFYDYRYEPFDQSKNRTGGFYDNKNQSDKSELIEYNFDLSPQLNVPGDWNSQDEKLDLYEGTIWYRKVFRYTPETGKKYYLYFGAVNYEAHVYVNGKKAGMHKGGFTPFQFDVTDKLKDGENFVVVKADNKRKAEEVPTVNTDWWNYGGITRDVYIVELPESHIADYKVQLEKGNLNLITGFVQLDGDRSNQPVTIAIPELKINTTVSTDASGKAIFSIQAKKISHWSPDNPKLYDVNVSTASDKVKDKIGFRTIEIKGTDIMLNNKSVFLRGISIHDENPLIKGRFRGQGDMRMMLEWAKELNCNYVRLAHYTHNEEMVRLADELGLMLWAEVPVYWTIAWENPATFHNARQQLTDMVDRDKNRASVIVWSIGNETPLSEPRHKFMGEMAAHARSLDDTRLVAAALEVHREGTDIIVNDPLGDKLDLASFNQYGGWYWEMPQNLHQYNFKIKLNKPVVITEFGGGAVAGFHADAETRFSEEFQEEVYIHQLKMLEKIEALRGMTPWILADFRSPRRQHPVFQDFWNRKGLLSETGQKKKAFYVLKNYYDKKEQEYK